MISRRASHQRASLVAFAVTKTLLKNPLHLGRIQIVRLVRACECRRACDLSSSKMLPNCCELFCDRKFARTGVAYGLVTLTGTGTRPGSARPAFNCPCSLEPVLHLQPSDAVEIAPVPGDEGEMALERHACEPDIRRGGMPANAPAREYLPAQRKMRRPPQRLRLASRPRQGPVEPSEARPAAHPPQEHPETYRPDGLFARPNSEAFHPHQGLFAQGQGKVEIPGRQSWHSCEKQQFSGYSRRLLGAPENGVKPEWRLV